MAELAKAKFAHAEVAQVADHFDRLVERYGASHRALDYGSRMSQRVRFDVLASGLELAGRRVLDVGCGMADFKGYLDERGIRCTYAGVDASPRMTEEARRRYGDVALTAGDILAPGVGQPCDVAVANGIFYLLGDRADVLLRAIVGRMWELAEEAIAFTSLSTWGQGRSAGEFHANPAEVLEFCRTLTPWVRLRHDYLPHDFAVFLYKRAREE